VLRSLNYARISSAHWDPIEKKPLFHFYPGRQTLSLGTVGCNLACAFCQNWSISHAAATTRRMTPAEAVALAQTDPANIGISYTYNEPFIWYEFVLETAQLAKQAGLKNSLVTNGYVNEAPLRELLPHVDAMNIDIKAMGEDFYRELCRGRPEPPRRTAEVAKQAGCLVEITNLVIPNWNDRDEDFQTLVDWVAALGEDTPLHFSRYHPDYQLTEPPTPPETLFRAREIAQKTLHYVYVGNLWATEAENTICPSCGKVVVERRGFAVSHISVKDQRCEFCGAAIPIVGT
jgi:pyruvate formate lyase activating enzyme